MITSLKKVSNTILARISKNLPDWKEDEAIVMVPALRAQKYRLPVNIKDLPADLAAHFVALTNGAPETLPALSIYVVKKANVSFIGAPFKNLQLFRPDMSPYTDGYFRNNYLLMQWLAPKHRVKHSTTAALIYDIWSSQNYYHWLVESLPRLLMLRKAFPDIDIILPTPTTAFIKETLALLDFTKFIPVVKDDFLKVDTLIIPQKLPFIELQLEDAATERHEFGLHVVREKLLNSLPKSANVAPHRRVYVSRARQPFRRLCNEEEIVVILTKYDFEIFYFEELSFEQQVHLMQETAVLIGLHGANLTNLMFMQPDTIMIELMNIDSGRLLFYFFMASYFRLNYYCMPCASVDSVTTNQTDVIIESQYLERLLESIFPEFGNGWISNK